VYESLTTSEQKNRITFTAESLPPCAGDPILIRQVWQNLISNAIKFSAHQNNPRISITGTETPEYVEYCIQDNGVGFDMRYANKLFTMFSKLHSGNSFEGQGIGLALCKEILAKHGGTIRADSKPGEGARFYITLPKTPERSLS
jgi:light-regulated signal transduction histidine kinase (bacteriophytochrome)